MAGRDDGPVHIPGLFRSETETILFSATIFNDIAPDSDIGDISS